MVSYCCERLKFKIHFPNNFVNVTLIVLPATSSLKAISYLSAFWYFGSMLQKFMIHDVTHSWFMKPLKTVTLLGFTLDQHLLYSEHINGIITKCRGLVGVLRKVSKLLPRELLHLMFVALIRCHLEYGSATFHAAASTQTVVQKIASRIICDAPSDAHAETLLRELNLDSYAAVSQNGSPL